MAEYDIKNITQLIRFRFAVDKLHDTAELIIIPTNKVDITEKNFKCVGRIESLIMVKSGFSLIASSPDTIHIEYRDEKITIQEELF